MEGQTGSRSSWHPGNGDLISHLDGELGWAVSLRVRIHLMRCKACVRRLGTMEEQMEALANVGKEELQGIRQNLMEAMRAFESGSGSMRFEVTPEIRKLLEEYVGVRMAAQLTERVLQARDGRAAYDSVDRTLRLLMGGKAAASLRSRLLQEMPR